MNTTIAVTLITAISTLAGASISGYVAFLVSRAQGRTQVEIAQGQQLDQRSAERRQIRRDVYVQFLNQLGVVENILDNLWVSKTSITGGEIIAYVEPAVNAIRDLERVVDLVSLEGPLSIWASAKAMVAILTVECVAISEVVKQAAGQESPSVNDFSKYKGASMERSKLKRSITKAAQKSLDQVLNPTEIL